MKILCVEDDPVTQMIIKSTLDGIGEIQTCESYDSAIDKLKSETFDLAILDIQLTQGSGLDVCSYIRTVQNDSQMSILFLTSSESIESKVKVFSTGANDFLAKPFHPLELKVRVEALGRFLSVSNNPSKIRRVEGLELNSESCRVFLIDRKNRTEIQLTKKCYKLLQLFLDDSGRVFSREDILNRIWDQELNVCERTVDAHISRLRKALGDWGQAIESVHGFGYRLSLPKKSAFKTRAS